MSDLIKDDMQTLKILKLILAECEGSLRHLYLAVSNETGDAQGANPMELIQFAGRLESELAAASAIAGNIENSGVGWPDEFGQVLTLNEIPSGYPVDLVTGLLHKAESMATMIRLVFQTEPESTAISGGTANCALWGVHGLVLEVLAVISHITDDAELTVNTEKAA